MGSLSCRDEGAVACIIGGKPGTGGSACVSYLESTLGRRCFPELWALRTRL